MEGAAEVPEGFTWRNVLGSYVHLHFGSCPQLASSLVERCRQVDLAALNAAVGAAQKQVASMLSALTAKRQSPLRHSAQILVTCCLKRPKFLFTAARSYIACFSPMFQQLEHLREPHRLERSSPTAKVTACSSLLVA